MECYPRFFSLWKEERLVYTWKYVRLLPLLFHRIRWYCMEAKDKKRKRKKKRDFFKKKGKQGKDI